MPNACDTDWLQGFGQECGGHWTKMPFWLLGGQGTLIWKSAKKVANSLGIPVFCAHHWMKRAFAQSSLEIVPLMTNGMRAKKLSWKFAVTEATSGSGWAHTNPSGFLAWHGIWAAGTIFIFQPHWNVGTSPCCGLGSSRGLDCSAFCLRPFFTFLTSLAWFYGTRVAELWLCGRAHSQWRN